MVTYFSSLMTGAPTISGTAGTMIATLDACLVTGFGLQSVTTLVVAGGVATVSLPSAHGIPVGACARIAGATPAGLNGDWPVTAVTSQTFTFATSEADGTATGSITFKHAPLGWAKEFSGTNLAAYRSADVTGTRMRLRVDHSGTTFARVLGYETMSDINTGTGPFPTEGQLAGGLYWHLSSAANTTAVNWYVVGDGVSFYLYVEPTTSTNPGHGYTYFSGDYNSVRVGDPYAGLLLGQAAVANYNSGSASDVGLGEFQVNTGAYVARSYTGLGGAQQCYKTSAFCTDNNRISGLDNYSATNLAYPNGPDNGLVTSQVHVLSNSALRGQYPGLLHTPQSCQNVFNTGEFVTGTGAYAGHKLLALRSGGALNYDKNNVYGGGVIFIDTTGPWR